MTKMIIKSDYLKQLVDILSADALDCSEMLMKIEKKMGSIRLVNASATGGLILEVKSEMNIDTDETVFLSLSLNDLRGVIKLCKTDDDVEISFDSGVYIFKCGNIKRKVPAIKSEWREKFPALILNDTFTMKDEQVKLIVKAFSDSRKDDAENSSCWITVNADEGIEFKHNLNRRETIINFPVGDLENVSISENYKLEFPAHNLRSLLDCKIGVGNTVLKIQNHRFLAMGFETEFAKVVTVLTPYASND